MTGARVPAGYPAGPCGQRAPRPGHEEGPPERAFLRSPLPDSNRRPLPYHGSRAIPGNPASRAKTPATAAEPAHDAFRRGWAGFDGCRYPLSTRLALDAPLSPQCGAGYHVLCRAFRAGRCACRCHDDRTTDHGGPVPLSSIPRAGLDGPSRTVRVEPVELPDVTPAPAREAPAEPVPAGPPDREPERVG